MRRSIERYGKTKAFNEDGSKAPEAVRKAYEERFHKLMDKACEVKPARKRPGHHQCIYG